MKREGPLWDALDRTHLMVEFDRGGTVRWANDRFLSSMGYTLSDVVGRDHAIFCTPDDVRSSGYRPFWNDLIAGGYRSGRFRRVAADRGDVWLQAMYTPVAGVGGRPDTIVKLATVVTEEVTMAQEVSLELTRTLIARAEQEQDRDIRESMIARLGEVVDAISALAKQTNLLSLNASIEAGRAGPGAHALSILAAEMKKIADQTRAATDKARSLIDG